MFQQECTIINNTRVNNNYFILEIFYPENVNQIIPGQFIQLKLINKEECLFRRPFSISFVDEVNNSISLLIQIVGKTTAHLSTIKKGDLVDLISPLGNGFSIDDSQLHILVGGGVGVAPLYLLAKRLKENKADKVISFLGYSGKDFLAYEEELKKFSDKVIVATNNGSYGQQGFVTEVMEGFLQSENSKENISIYACGPKPMLKALSELSQKYKVKCQASFEEYMACGIGVCVGCVVKTKVGEDDYTYKRACKEGPVFNLEEVLWS